MSRKSHEVVRIVKSLDHVRREIKGIRSVMKLVSKKRSRAKTAYSWRAMTAGLDIEEQNDKDENGLISPE